MPEVLVGGHRVSFRLDGPADGPVFAFVNGLTQYSDLWAAYADHLADLPMRETIEDAAEISYLADIRSLQHPDHDTDPKDPT